MPHWHKKLFFQALNFDVYFIGHAYILISCSVVSLHTTFIDHLTGFLLQNLPFCISYTPYSFSESGFDTCEE